MKAYIGTKIVLAEPMDEYSAFNCGFARGWTAVGSDGKGRDGYKVVYEDGYTSWSPKDTFERAYRPITDAERVLMAPTVSMPVTAEG